MFIGAYVRSLPNPLIAVDATWAEGYDLARTLWNSGFHNQYRWKRFDSEGGKPTNYIGWQTDARTKPILEAHLRNETGRRMRTRLDRARAIALTVAHDPMLNIEQAV